MAKGAAFEREICKTLSLWWTGGENENVFWRTSNSGGRATAQRRSGRKMQVHCGDLCAIDPVGQPFLDLFAVELKRGYRDATLHDLLDKSAEAKLQTFQAWIGQAQEARDQAAVPYWLLITRRDRREALVTMPVTALCLLECFDVTPKLVLQGMGFLEDLVVTTLSQWLVYVQVVDLENEARYRRRRSLYHA